MSFPLNIPFMAKEDGNEVTAIAYANAPTAIEDRSIVVIYKRKMSPNVIFAMQTEEFFEKHVELERQPLAVDLLAGAIRTVDGSNRLGASELAEKLLPFIEEHYTRK